MAEFRKWTLHFDDGNNTIDGRRVQDPPGFTAAGGKELVSVQSRADQHHAELEFQYVKKQQTRRIWFWAGCCWQQQVPEHGCGSAQTKTAGGRHLVPLACNASPCSG